MQFDEFDKRIQDAAEHHHPAYDEQAWAKMHGLLDKHLPVKEERRRRFIIWFFLGVLLTGGGMFYMVQHLKHENGKAVKQYTASAPVKSKNESQQSSSRKDEQMKEVAAGESKYSQTEKEETETDPHVSESKTKIKDAGKNLPVSDPVFTLSSGSPVMAVMAGKKGKKKNKVVPDNDKPYKTVQAVPGTDKDEPVSDAVIKPEVKNINPVVAETPKNEISSTAVAGETAVPAIKKTDSLTQDITTTVSGKNNKVKKKQQSYFFLTLSAGPDMSFTASGKAGPVIPVTGAGLGYVYKNRVSIRAGFYNAVKKYAAKPDAYKAPASFYNYYPYLLNVDANCRVYEIPVSLSYHFGANGNHSWFAGASVSSYLMKRETYDYTYKSSAWSTTIQQREWTIRNRNQHMFSVLGFSAGYQYAINKRVSIIAEPYYRLPLQGVGYGKVKLNSAGVLFSVAVKPASFFSTSRK